jgi:hypothetical protein
MGRRVYRRVELGESIIPEEAIALIEDIQTLERIRHELERLHVPSEDVRKMRWRIGYLVAAMHSIAQEELRYCYLAGKKLKPKGRTQTLADVWQMIRLGE